MKVRDVRQGLALALVVIAACAMNPRPGDPGYPYNLDGRYEATFLVNGERGAAATGEMTILARGRVRGTHGGIVPLRAVTLLPPDVRPGFQPFHAGRPPTG